MSKDKIQYFKWESERRVAIKGSQTNDNLNDWFILLLVVKMAVDNKRINELSESIEKIDFKWASRDEFSLDIRDGESERVSRFGW